jgi:hypothetical protein
LNALGQISSFAAGAVTLFGNGNTVNVTYADNHLGPVYKFFIVADTGGDDVSDDDNPDDDARIVGIQFFNNIPITISDN